MVYIRTANTYVWVQSLCKTKAILVLQTGMSEWSSNDMSETVYGALTCRDKLQKLSDEAVPRASGTVKLQQDASKTQPIISILEKASGNVA